VIVVGLDPGSRRAGYAVMDVSGRAPLILDLGCWELMKRGPSLGARLEGLYELARALFQLHNPRWIGLERAFQFRNVDSAFKLTEARGVLRLAAHQTLESAEDRLIEVSPSAVKKHASGMGGLSKEGVSKALKMRFPNLESLVADKGDLAYDAYDALAVAWSAWALQRDPSRLQELR
jgi:crossover junction endodeoxyribonuclease RuvC